uniref:Transthyretin/hydroxyisourate hydrolase domain-containing protein n=1 Tax=Panagrellus redivivus TaxID=6233 RepID=A0A7E4W518_PANRE
MRCLLLLFFIPVISANWYSVKARVVCDNRHYNGFAAMTVNYWGIGGLGDYERFPIEIVDGWLKATIDSPSGWVIYSYHIEIPHECSCPKNTVHNIDKDDEKILNRYRSKEDAEEHTFFIGVINLNNDCPGFITE